MRETIKKFLPWPVLFFYRKTRSLFEDAPHVLRFLFHGAGKTSFGNRLRLILKSYQISYKVPCPHMEGEMIQVFESILKLSDPNAIIVEAGSFKGGSTAKISLAARLAGRKLFVFDSFEGIPENDEKHDKNIFGGDAYFPKGSYAGTLEEVKNNCERYGDIESCEFIKGWFSETMPNFDKQIGVAYMDVDLVSSTKTCLKYLYPLLTSEGKIFSQDGHLPLIINLLRDNGFWRKELGQDKPKTTGLGMKKLVCIMKS